MSRVLVDASVLIDFLRQRGKARTIFHALIEMGEHQFLISVITHAEMYAGSSVWKKAKARQELEELFRGLQILPLSLTVSEQAGRIRAAHGSDLIDAVVAATAIEHGVPVLTLDVADFKKIKGLKLFLL